MTYAGLSADRRSPISISDAHDQARTKLRTLPERWRHTLAVVNRTETLLESAVTDALTYAEQSVGLRGLPMNLRDRIDRTMNRNGTGSANARARQARVPYLLAVADRVERRLVAVA